MSILDCKESCPRCGKGPLDFKSLCSDAYICRFCGETISGLEVFCVRERNREQSSAMGDNSRVPSPEGKVR
jgi:hypothetical protein